MLTRDMQSIFCQPAICERLALMLNYFLQHLVGSFLFGILYVVHLFRLDLNDAI